jgi:rubredoxin
MSFGSDAKPSRTLETPKADPLSPPRWKVGLKTIVPRDVLKVVDRLWARRKDFPATFVCPDCGDVVPLAAVDVEWPYAIYSVAFPRVPAYRCERCDRIYFPESVRAELAAQVERTISAQKPVPLQRNPRALAFTRRYAHR